MKDYAFLQQKYIVNTFPNRGLILVSGEGVYLQDIHGEKFLDLMTNYGVNIFGYGHPEIIKSLVHQIQRLTTLHGSFVNDIRAEAAEVLVKRCGGGFSQVYFSNSGAESNEAALKFAVLATGKKKFVCCRGGYHGKTLGALSATDGKKYRTAFEPLLWEFIRIEYNRLPELEAALDGQTAAFIVEPIQGEAGIIEPSQGYLKRAAEICAAKDVLLILDEVQTGAGRTGVYLASQSEGISGDIVTLGKGLAGGVPIGATLVSHKIAEKIPRSSHTSTFGGNPLAAAGILAVHRLLDGERLAHIKRIGNDFVEGLKKIRDDYPDYIKMVRGRGLMIGLEVAGERDDILKKLQEQKVLAIPASDHVVRFLPPYIIEKKDVGLAADKINKILANLSKSRTKGVPSGGIPS